MENSYTLTCAPAPNYVIGSDLLYVFFLVACACCYRFKIALIKKTSNTNTRNNRTLWWLVTRVPDPKHPQKVNQHSGTHAINKPPSPCGFFSTAAARSKPKSMCIMRLGRHSVIHSTSTNRRTTIGMCVCVCVCCAQ